jgi:hypothetical protein
MKGGYWQEFCADRFVSKIRFMRDLFIMNSALLEELLKRSELPTLDFKLEPYDFTSANHKKKEYKRAEFAKDIICMANTPRNEPAYIVIGVKRQPDGTNCLKGLTVHLDDNCFQQGGASFFL